MSSHNINQIDLFTTEATHRLQFVDKITGVVSNEYLGKECKGTFKQMIWQQAFYKEDSKDVYTIISRL